LPDGSLLVACYDEGTLVRLNREGKELQPPILAPGGKPFTGPNDFAADPCGGIYFSASGKWEKDAKPEGKVYYRSPAGQITEVADNIFYANGLAVVKEGRRLLVAEGMRNQVLQFDIGEGGTLTGRSVWRRLADIRPDPGDADWSTGPDGLKADSRGNLYICQFGAARILVTRPDGGWLRTIPVPLKGVTNLAFGPGEETLYVTAVKDANEPFLGAVYEIPNR
jgi:sugar lactone lactonase YvrE